MSKIRIFSLGGLNENGKNMYVVEVDKNIYVFDAGLKFDNEKNLGIDYIIPNFDYLIKNSKRVKGIFLTHGHDGNMGAIPDILKSIPYINIYGAKLTLEILKQDLDPVTIKKSHLIEVKPHKKIPRSQIMKENVASSRGVDTREFAAGEGYSELFGNCKVYIFWNQCSYIAIKTKDSYILLNKKGDEQTYEFYSQLMEDLE